MTIRFAASIVLSLVATTSAFAAEADASPTPAVTVSAATTAAATAARRADPDTRFCLRHPRPASRIWTRVCDTRRNLTAMGYDMDAVLRTNAR